jgi:hypothetical protein
MSGTSDPSNREMLERLTAELRCLRPDVREPEFKNWRADVTAAMAELFGPGHRMTVALRDVNFSPRFEQGRTRAMALLRAASSLVMEALPEAPAAAAPPTPVTASPAPASEDTVAAPTSDASPEPLPDPTPQRTGAIEDEPPHFTAPDQTADAVLEQPVPAGPVADVMADTAPIVAEPAPAETAAAEPVAGDPSPEESGDEEPVALRPADDEPAEPLQWPYLADWPTPAAVAVPESTPVDASAELPNAEPGAEAPEPESIAAATEMPDDDADRPLSATEEDAFTMLMLAAEARPKPAATPEAAEAVAPTLAASEPEIVAGEPKRGTFLKKIARKHGRFRGLPALPGEPAAEAAPALITEWTDDAESVTPAPEMFATPWSDAVGSPEFAAEPAADDEIAADHRPAADHEIGPVIEAALAAEPEPAPEPDPIEEPAVPEPEVPAQVAAVFDADPDDFVETDPADVVPVAPHVKAVPRARAPRRSKHRLKRLRVPVVALLVGLGVGMWLWMFGGWSTMYVLGANFGPEMTLTLPAAAEPNPSGNARVVDAADDSRSEYIVQVVRAGIVRLSVTAAGEVSFMPAKLVARGEFLVWLDRVQRIPVGSRDVPETLYFDLDRRLRILAIDAYQQRIVLDWPGENTKIAFSGAKPIVARDAEAWAARLVLRLLPSTTLASALGITHERAVDLRARISSLKTQELTMIVQGFALRPEAGWAKEQSITRSEAAEFLMRLKAVFEKYPALTTQ